MQVFKAINFFSELRRFFWPIEVHENKKFIPMVLILSCISLNYVILKSVKDVLVINYIGVEAISFLNLYFILPLSIIMIILYIRIYNLMNQQRIFYIFTSCFIAYFAFFTFILYPNPEIFHRASSITDSLVDQYPATKWFTKIAGNWIYASFYIISEMWGMMLGLLFWQLANQITNISEAKRFYPMFGLLGGILSLFVTMPFYFFKDDNFVPVLSISLIVGILILFLYKWINQRALANPELYNFTEFNSKKQEKNLNLTDSFKMIFTSRYLGSVFIIMFCYNLSFSLVEGIWKSKIKELYSEAEGYISFMGTFMWYRSFLLIFFVIIGINIMHRVSWFTASVFTPVMILSTGLAFFLLVLFAPDAFWGISSLVIIVIIGSAQNILSGAAHASLFTPTKEMLYIPLDDEIKAKSRAIVGVLGNGLAIGAGSFIQSIFFVIMPSCSFSDAYPFFAVVFFATVILWIFTVRILSKKYNTKIEKFERRIRCAQTVA